MTFQFREDGYFNMTKAAKHFGKRVQDFFDNMYVNEYIAELVLVFNHADRRELIQAKRGGNHGGTGVTPSWPCSSLVGWT
ncbi:hypothetical protein GKE73_10950 [Paludibacterium sp. dN 18-1]|uniref:KilA-N DNA-binding domain-containing protein n=2 Tax=Paludibacterium denitrificans TaxID=2675226 RepID=A0A844GAK6_9NEIS|nr:hypothetical protein [Paludibacterium denitrificans]